MVELLGHKVFPFFMFILFILRDRAQAGEGQTGRERENPSRLCAVSAEPEVGLDLTTRSMT